MEVKIKGKPKRGRSRTSFLKQVTEDTGIGTYCELERIISVGKNEERHQ